jgi:tetratricopeptide (TPR) repeat protein
MGGERGPIRDAPAADAVAYQKVIDSGDPDRASEAANNLGWLLAKQGDVTGARAAYQVAIDSGHRDYAPRAANNLGGLLAEHGDVARAQAAYQVAIDSGHRDYAPRARQNLRELLEQHPQNTVVQKVTRTLSPEVQQWGARPVEPAAAPPAPPVSAEEWYRQGEYWHGQGDLPQAAAAFQAAIDSGDPQWNPLAWCAVGLLLFEQGDLANAQAALQNAVNSGHPTAAPRAGIGMGDLLAHQGRDYPAQQFYAWVMTSGHPDYSVWATYSQAMSYIRTRDIFRWQSLLNDVVRSQHPEFMPAAALYLGEFEARCERFTQAEKYYGMVANSGHAEYSRAAIDKLAAMRAWRSSMVSAELDNVADTSPAAAVMEGFARVERRLRDRLSKAGRVVKGRKAKELADDALNSGLISPDIHASVKRLLHTRNSVAHGVGPVEVTTVEAKNFLRTADQIIYLLSD